MSSTEITADSSHDPADSFKLSGRTMIDCVHQLISRRAKQQPDVNAVVDDYQAITYGELDRRSDRLAAHLQQLGVEEEVLIGLAMPPTIELLVGMLAVLKAGGAYVPLDPTYPRERLDFILNDASPALVLTVQSLAGELPLGEIDALLLDKNADQIFANEQVQLRTVSNLANLAYVIYTSGSTGTPKGVLIEHRGLSDMAQFHAKQFGLGHKSNFLQFASPCFDASVLEIFCTLTSGATLHLAEPTNRTPGSPLIETLKQRKISHVLLPPSTLEVLPDTPLPDLETLISGGEPCSAEIVHRWAAGRQFVNAYGPTEATVTATTWICQPDEAGDPPIGHACDNTVLYVMDPEGNRVPPGQPGELYVGGSGVARGYLNLPELTELSFLPDPFSNEANAKIYKTGDRVRQREDGALEFLGRLDRQVKVRGFRIEPEEIEANLLKHPAVQQVHVQASGSLNSRRSMAAYCVAAEPLDSKDLRSWLEDLLPNYMLPAHYMVLDQLPREQNGDINSENLPSPILDNSSEQQVRDSSLESKMIEIWSEVLGFEHIDLDDHFIELGGDSLLSVRIAEKSQQHGMDVSPQDILSYPTIGELVELLTKG